MTHFERLAIFWLVVYAILWGLRRHPRSVLARIAFSWNGPYPFEGERKSSYYRRKSIFALTWLLQIITVGALVALAAWLEPNIAQSQTFLLAIMFALTLGGGMALVGAALALATSIKASKLGPDPVFHSSTAQSQEQQ